MNIKKLSDLNITNKRIFIRADLNVPIQDGKIGDDTRIRASVPAIEYALKQNAAVMVTSHLGRPEEGVFSEENSLAPIAKRLAELLGKPVELKRDWIDGVEVKSGQIVLL